MLRISDVLARARQVGLCWDIPASLFLGFLVIRAFSAAPSPVIDNVETFLSALLSYCSITLGFTATAMSVVLACIGTPFGRLMASIRSKTGTGNAFTSLLFQLWWSSVVHFVLLLLVLAAIAAPASASYATSIALDAWDGWLVANAASGFASYALLQLLLSVTAIYQFGLAGIYHKLSELPLEMQPKS